MALPFLILGAVMDIANLCWLSSPPYYKKYLELTIIVSSFFILKKNLSYC